VILPHSIPRRQAQGLGALTCPPSPLETMRCHGTRQPLSPQYGRHLLGRDQQPRPLKWSNLTNLGCNSSIGFLDISRSTSPRMSIHCPRRHPSKHNSNSQPHQALHLKASHSPIQILLLATQMHRFRHHRCLHRENQQNQYTSAINQATQQTHLQQRSQTHALQPAIRVQCLRLQIRAGCQFSH
jgi:hypothetical protein